MSTRFQLQPAIIDWDDAYANGPHIPASETYPPRWSAAAQRYRSRMLEAGQCEPDVRYGNGERNLLDLFLPAQEARGLVVFVHGGYWKALDKSYWSHLAAGAIARGWAVAMTQYTLCPDARIAQITAETGAAVEAAAARIPGPIRLTGHSAGGHLVTRMITTTTPLSAQTASRVVQTLSISGVHDLRPLLHTEMNDTLRLDAGESRLESPVLLEPLAGTRLTCWVGAAERPEFVRQNALLASVWRGLGASTCAVEEPSLHHFNVLDSLEDAESGLVNALLA